MIRYAVAGAGPWGKNHLRVADELGDIELRVVADTDREILKSVGEKYKVAVTLDYRDVLRSDAEAVSICLPASLHFTAAKEFLTAGKHVLLEKPMTLKSSEAEKLIALAKSKSLVLAVGHIFRFDPALKKLKEEISKGTFGKIYAISLARLGLKNPRSDVGAILNYATHDLDIMCDLLEQQYPDEITAVASYPLGRQYEDIAFIMARFGSTLCHTQVSWLTPKKVREFLLIGEKKSASVDSIGFEVELFDCGIVQEVDDFNTFRLVTKSGPSSKLAVEKREPLKDELSHFAECISKGSSPVNSGEVGLRAIKMAEAALESARRGCTVRLTAQGDVA